MSMSTNPTSTTRAISMKMGAVRCINCRLKGYILSQYGKRALSQEIRMEKHAIAT